MSTINVINSKLFGTTGTTGNLVGNISPTLVTPTLGVATASSLTFSSTTGLKGTTTNNNPAAGSVGEFIQSQVLASSAVSFTTNGTNYNITSITLSAGDWDVFGNLYAIITGTNITTVIGWISTTSATKPDNSNVMRVSLNDTNPHLTSFNYTVPYLRVNSSSSSTIVYLSAQSSFTSTSTISGAGTIHARRAR